MPLPQSAIDARARRDARRNNPDRPKITTSSYANAQRDKDQVISPMGERLDKPMTALDAYKSDRAGIAFEQEKKRARTTTGSASARNPLRFNTTA